MMRSSQSYQTIRKISVLLLAFAVALLAGCGDTEETGSPGVVPIGGTTLVASPADSGTDDTSVTEAPEPISAPPVTAATSWPALTYEGWVDQVELVVVGTVAEVSEPRASGAIDATDSLVEEFQTVTIKVDQIIKKIDVRLAADVEEGSTIQVVHSITLESSVFPKDMIGRRTVAVVGVRDPLLGSNEEDDLLTIGIMSSYIEIDGAAILYADAFATTAYTDRLALSPEKRLIADSGEETLSVSTVDNLILRASNTKTPLEEQLGYDELYGERIPDQESTDSP